MKTIDEMIEIAEDKVKSLTEYKYFREHVVDKMNWEAMKHHPADEEHEESWFSEPDIDDTYYYPKYLFFKHVLETLDKEFLK